MLCMRVCNNNTQQTYCCTTCLRARVFANTASQHYARCASTRIQRIRPAEGCISIYRVRMHVLCTLLLLLLAWCACACAYANTTARTRCACTVAAAAVASRYTTVHTCAAAQQRVSTVRCCYATATCSIADYCFVLAVCGGGAGAYHLLQRSQASCAVLCYAHTHAHAISATLCYSSTPYC